MRIIRCFIVAGVNAVSLWTMKCRCVMLIIVIEDESDAKRSQSRSHKENSMALSAL